MEADISLLFSALQVTLSAMAKELGNTSGAAYWEASATGLLPVLRSTFYRVDAKNSSRGFFQDAYYNGTFLEEQGCEGYAMLGRF